MGLPAPRVKISIRVHRETMRLSVFGPVKHATSECVTLVGLCAVAT